MPTASTPLTGTAPTSHASRATGLPQLLKRLSPTTLAQLDAVALLDRSDTKFVLTQSQLTAVLPALAQHYRVLEVQGQRMHRYRTIYFDTPELDLYRHHHAGRAVRHKVRSRLYVDTGLSFFEIKSKRDTHRTVKRRIATPEFLTHLTPDARAFVDGQIALGPQALQPALRNDFLRVTLVGKRYAERLTLDVNIQFDCEGRTAVLPGIVIAELKQGSPDQDSPFLHAMQQAQVAATSISKYCVGIGMLVATVEHDAFDEKLRHLERLMRTQADGSQHAPSAALASEA